MYEGDEAARDLPVLTSMRLALVLVFDGLGRRGVANRTTKGVYE